MKPILELHKVGKEYKIGGQHQGHLNFRERLKNMLKPKNQKELFWALQDISFNVNPGESVGIIGRNGAGKSTLLKILSKITPPTKGFVRARGRVASLLEVGTGFHSELTGRENIYLNGSILGLRRAEINRKFDQIVDFSGVEQFLDTPLKHYSSGMTLRLAFSVAAHLEPEILLVDEVLAVGDAEFQKKCIDKMEAIRQSGLTILFVSHDLDAVKKLCRRGILLQKGELIKEGETTEVINHYLSSFSKKSNQNTIEISDKKLFDEFVIKEFRTKLEGRKFISELEIEGGDFKNITAVAIQILNLSGEGLSVIDWRKDWKNAFETGTGKNVKITSVTDLIPYVEGMYNFRLWIEYRNTEWFISDYFGMELPDLNTQTEKYPAKYRGFFDLDTEAEINFSK